MLASRLWIYPLCIVFDILGLTRVRENIVPLKEEHMRHLYASFSKHLWGFLPLPVFRSSLLPTRILMQLSVYVHMGLHL